MCCVTELLTTLRVLLTTLRKLDCDKNVGCMRAAEVRVVRVVKVVKVSGVFVI